MADEPGSRSRSSGSGQRPQGARPQGAKQGGSSANRRRRRPSSGSGGGRPGQNQARRGSGGGNRSQTSRARERPTVAEAAVAERAVRTVAPAAPASQADDPYASAAANRRRALVVAAVPGLLVLLVIAGVLSAAGEAIAGIVAGLVLGALVSLSLWRAAPGLVLGALGARPVDEDDVPGPATLVEGLCASMGLAPPELRVVDDAAPNALAVGRSTGDAVLVLTSGLLDGWGQVELEGVLAHELVHVKRNDVAPATLAAALMIVAVVVPGAPRVVHRLAGRGREFATDRQAVRVTRYPPGLRQALERMSDAQGPRGALAGRRAGQVTRWLWTTVLPDAEGRRPEGDEAIGELDLPGVRVAALDEW